MRFIMLFASLVLGAYAANTNPLVDGRSIFMTGRDVAGVRITASPRPLRSSCVQCHRADGSGGMHFPGGVVSADLRHDALTKGQKHPYTIVLLERAISRGIDNDGGRLSPVMPRWRMSKADLRAVATYVAQKLR